MTRLAERKSKLKDLVLLVLAAGIIGSNIIWYGVYRDQNRTNRADVSAWLDHQVEINKLKACFDNNIRPCNIDPDIK